MVGSHSEIPNNPTIPNIYIINHKGNTKGQNHMRILILGVIIMAIVTSTGVCARTTVSGSAKHENVLIGMHFIDGSSDDAARALNGGDPVNIAAGFYDYLKYMPEDLTHFSYADFWRWWFTLERYKGDEHGLRELDAVVEECLTRGMKVKIDLAHSTFWTLDKDWEKDADLVSAPKDLDDWAHICYLLGNRYRGRIALWLLLGEANGKDYWPGMTIEHAQEAYKIGYLAFKRGDPGTLISTSGATPGEGRMTIFDKPNDREQMDRWVRENLAACKGHYDDVPMNYFADVKGADPYNGLDNYYRSIRGILDGLGETDVEIGSGESSVQWALSSYDITGHVPWTTKLPDSGQPPLSEGRQTWRLNESLGTFYDMGGNKFMMWGTEFAPGGGWPWRWGFRKFEDWWGVFPQSAKVPGTRIVYGYNNPHGRKVDLRKGWTSSQTDPYHPDWEVFKFWAQTSPPFAEAVRLPMDVKSLGPRVLRLATYLQTMDRCVALLQSDEPAKTEAALDLTRTGWPDGTSVLLRMSNDSINYENGKHIPGLTRSINCIIKDGKVAAKLPTTSGFTTINITRIRPALNAELAQVVVPDTVECGTRPSAAIVIRNLGASAWKQGAVTLVQYQPGISLSGEVESWKPGKDVAPRETVSIDIRLPSSDAPCAVTWFYRMRDDRGRWFGPVLPVSVQIVDNDAPRKLVAHREFGHIRVRWFAPEKAVGVAGYNLYRAEGLGKEFTLLKKVDSTEYIDDVPQRDKAYYYRVTAIRRGGRESRPSNEDNAKALSKPRQYDAEVVSQDIPKAIRIGESSMVTITIRNTGSKPWDFTRPKELSFNLSPMQQWGCFEEGKLSKMALDTGGMIEPGQTVTLTIPYAPDKIGRFENQWITAMELVGKSFVYFGTPLIVETTVLPK